MIIIIIGMKLETFTDKNQISLSYSQLTLLWDVEWTSCPAWKWKWERDSSDVRASSFWASGGLEPAFILDFGLPVGLGSGKFASDRLLVGLGLFLFLCYYNSCEICVWNFSSVNRIFSCWGMPISWQIKIYSDIHFCSSQHTSKMMSVVSGRNF